MMREAIKIIIFLFRTHELHELGDRIKKKGWTCIVKAYTSKLLGSHVTYDELKAEVAIIS